MPLSSTKVFFFFFSFLILYSTISISLDAARVPSGLEFLKVSPSKFVASLKEVSGVLQHVTSILRLNNVNAFEDFPLSNTISACLDLLELSVEELTWLMPTIENTLRGKHNGMGSLSSDLRMWLNATLANTNKCMVEFEGADGNIKREILAKIGEVNVLVNDLLHTKMHTISDHLTSQSHFPSWVQKLPQKIGVSADVVVAADGSGNYKKVMEAVVGAPAHSLKRYVIYIKAGVYKENVFIDLHKWNLMMIGDGMDVTIISSDLGTHVDNLTTYQTPTVAIKGQGFIAQDICFRNTAGPKRYQAVALFVNSDKSVFYRCEISGYQDTLCANDYRQFYRECKISGTIDFIFGYAAAVFQHCHILIKKGLEGQVNTITAQGGGKNLNHQFGFVFQFCNISADSHLLPYLNSTKSFLGRPWKPNATAIFMQSYISEVINPKGWLEWNGNLYLNTLYYAEYKNYGLGSRLQNRVTWPNYHANINTSEAQHFTVAEFIMGNQWLPSTGVPFDLGLQDEKTIKGK